MEKPNIILILTDHFRRDALRADVTPNLMSLAKAGTRFVNAYSASPLCQPARNCIITGRHASDNGVCGNQQPPIKDELRGDTFMHKLRQAGYYTAMVGKHHYIDRYGIGMDLTDDDDAIKEYGFDHVFQVADDGENLHNDDEYTHWLDQQGRLEEFRKAQREKKNNFHPFEPDETADGFIGVNGLNFIENYSENKPFYLNLSFIGPHPPFWHPGETRFDLADEMPLKGAKDDQSVRNKRCHYLEKCALIDSYIGRLIETLETRGMLENTVFIFTSDHGDMLGDYDIWDKRHFYEQSVGIPLFMAGGPVQKEERMCGNRISKELVSQLDIYPTLLEIAGIESGRHQKRPGHSLLSLLEGKIPGHPFVIAELATSMMIRTGNWKLVFDPQAGGIQQLHNLVTDPEELHNLAGKPGYEQTALDLVQKLLEDKIRRSQVTQIKEEQRLQRVHIS